MNARTLTSSESETESLTSLLLIINSNTDKLLTAAAKETVRTKEEEATLRLQHHLERFVQSTNINHIPHIDSDEYSPILLSLNVNSRMNRLLTKAAKRSGRTKSREATFRLCHHLARFISIKDEADVEGIV